MKPQRSQRHTEKSEGEEVRMEEGKSFLLFRLISVFSVPSVAKTVL
jgi:hypothetical protein